ncbi:hypothetical protein WA026_012714 [Henosepilachna vigintioctopunctata]|uniref:39S ribosomal protein L1, mitochondrial n=1 Tax=Henosepilachna vigintioctopunctata TaxID=420089 RepID=A0AAW1U5U6_9CUCU
MLSITQIFPISFLKTWIQSQQHIVIRSYAARKGTRDRKNKKKVKTVVEKIGFIPHNQRNREKLLAERPSRKFDDSWQRKPMDDIYCAKYYQWKIYPFQEAINCHKETHHPEIYNQPQAPVKALIELYMQGEKKTKFIENFNRICAVQHKFDHGEERKIIAFAKDIDSQQLAIRAGAQLTGGVELIKEIQNGKVSLQDFQFVIAHPDILHELSTLRGLMKKKFPNPKSGTLDIHLDEVVNRYLNGINYTAVKDEYEKDFGIIETIIGYLDMDPAQLEENFAALVKDVMVMKPKRDGKFITRTLLMSPPSGEQFKIDHKLYLEENDTPVAISEEEIDKQVVL